MLRIITYVESAIIPRKINFTFIFLILGYKKLLFLFFLSNICL